MASILILKKIVHFASRNRKYADTGYSYAVFSLYFENGNRRKFIHNATGYRDALKSARDYQSYTELPLAFKSEEVFD